MIPAFYKFILCMWLVSFCLPAQSATIILTSDQQLNDLLDPDKKIDLSTGFTKRFASLREVCEAAQSKGDHTLTIAFDEFFRQYREHAGTDRKLTPDMDEYIRKIKVIADFAAKYGMGMGLSLLSPLELGPAFKNQTGQTGEWMHYKVGLRDPATGKFHVQLWQQHYWTNNKGKFTIHLKEVKAYAFKEKHLLNSPFKAVDRDDIVPLSDVQFDEWGVGTPSTHDKKLDSDLWSTAYASDDEQKGTGAKRVSIFSNGSEEHKGWNRVLVMLRYEVPEMDYFSPKAYPFLQNLLKKYADNGIKIQHFYSDEMHIQQNWIYFTHHDNGQFALRYFTPAMGTSYREMHGTPLDEKDLLYFVYGPDIDSKSVLASTPVQYVMGNSQADIHRTYLFRDRYYKMLNNHVTDLFKQAKSYASDLFGVEDFGTRGHSSWAESPTVDFWNNEGLERHAYKYEYTPNFIWGNTVQQAAAACYDYFKWGEYLEPTRNDFGELGWNDRNYYGAAMATSIGVLNRIPNAYPAVWGMPAAVKERKLAINDAYGGRPRSESIDLITGHIHRDVDVLMLYPMNLVAVEERFGSWMTQYGYANFITAEKLLELGKINDKGELEVKDKTYSTLVALFEPLPQKGLLDMMAHLSEQGGKVIWFGPPPILNGAGEPCLNQWQELFGVDYDSEHLQGRIASGRRIEFQGALSEIGPQYILTDFVVDRIYPVQARNGTNPLAFCENSLLVGTEKGNAWYFGFRPRDDQSASLGYETRTLFEILDKVGAYPATGTFAGINDNPEYISRTTDYLATRFPNGATVLVRHYRTHKETWPGGFSRNPAEDSVVLVENPLPPADISVAGFPVNGHKLDYSGRLTMAFRMNEQNELIAFEGQQCGGVTIDGKSYTFSDTPLRKIAFAPALDNNKKELKIYVEGRSVVSIPLNQEIGEKKRKFLDDQGKKIKHTVLNGQLTFEVNPQLEGKWLSLTWGE